MAEDQIGLGRDDSREAEPWKRIFTAFKVALDPKKLLLAAAGIFLMALGWWVLSSFFYNFHRTPPAWNNYNNTNLIGEGKTYKTTDDALRQFKQDLNNWNLMHKLAGSPVVRYKPAGDGQKTIPEGQKYTIADFTSDPKLYDLAEQEMDAIRAQTQRKIRTLKVGVDEANKDDTIYFALDDVRVYFKTKSGGVGRAPEIVQKELEGKVQAAKLIDAYNTAKKTDVVELEGGHTLAFKKEGGEKEAEWQKFSNYVNSSKTLKDIQNEIVEGKRQGREEATRIALKVLTLDDAKIFKPAGYLSTFPWFEDRGPNPFLLVTGMAATSLDTKIATTGSNPNNFANWLVTEQLPVLLEPLMKFFSPVIYFLHPSAYFWTKVYLLLVILWTIAVWSFFGGAITRMASVQVARPTERVGMSEAIRFTVSRYRSYLAAQLLPLAFLAGIALILAIFGFFEVLIPLVGDIVIAGLGFPIVLLLGLMMAVVLVGLIGWPLMFATISTEGSDSFDAISRSLYSYVYQSPWYYLWYGFLALVYGAVLVFFVGLMGSLLVYMGKWGMSLPSNNIWNVWEREPTYLFRWAPTSYGWRDLLLLQSPEATTVPVIQNNGVEVQTYGLKEDYLKKMNFWNDAGSSMVAFWLYLLFLMIIGFGYSFFWTASSIIYLLMRRKVDDTEMDEVHLEEDELDTPYTPPVSASPAASPVATPAPGGRGVSLNVVEAAAFAPTVPAANGEGIPGRAGRPPVAPVHPAAPPPPAPRPTDGEPAVAMPAVETPARAEPVTGPSSAKKTQLAPEGMMGENPDKEEPRPDKEPGTPTGGATS